MNCGPHPLRVLGIILHCPSVSVTATYVLAFDLLREFKLQLGSVPIRVDCA